MVQEGIQLTQTVVGPAVCLLPLFIFMADKQKNLQRSVLRLVQISHVHLHFIFLAGVYVGHVELSH